MTPVASAEAAAIPSRVVQKDARVAYFAHARDEATYWGALVVLSAAADPLDFVYTEPVTLPRLALKLLGERVDGYVIERILLPALLPQAGSLQLLCFDEPAVLRREMALAVPCVVFAAPEAGAHAAGWTADAIGEDGAAGRETYWATSPGGDTRPLLAAMAARLAPASPRDPFTQLRAAMVEVRER